MTTTGITAMPRSILRISIWNFYLVFEPHVNTNGKAALLVFASRQVKVALVCFGSLYVRVSVIYLSDKNKKNKRTGFAHVGP